MSPCGERKATKGGQNGRIRPDSDRGIKEVCSVREGCDYASSGEGDRPEAAPVQDPHSAKDQDCGAKPAQDEGRNCGSSRSYPTVGPNTDDDTKAACEVVYNARSDCDKGDSIVLTDITSFDGEYRWLSNFWPSPIEVDGIKYPTVEHAYQAAKTDDPTVKQFIASQGRPGKAKYIGRSIKLRLSWDKEKVEIMQDLLRRKFAIPELRELLLKTGDTRLEEGNTWGDTFWGTNMGVGANMLGFSLMKIRQEINDQDRDACRT